MRPADDGTGVARIELAARMDRRRAEALALALRRRLKELGHGGATITIMPARAAGANGSPPASG